MTGTVKQATSSALKPVAAVVKAAKKPATHKAAHRITTVTHRVQKVARATGDSARSAGGTSANPQSPARAGTLAEIVRSTVGVVAAAESHDLAAGSGGLARDIVAGDSIAIAQGGGNVVVSNSNAVPNTNLVASRPVADPVAAGGVASGAAASGTVAPAWPSGSGPSPAGMMIGLAALLGVLGLGALRSGQIASGLALFGGTGGLRSATQFALMSRWSGHCVPLGGGGDVSANASVAGAAHRTTASVTGGRGEVKGVISAATPAGTRGGPAPSVALADPPALSRGNESPPAVLWGALLAASAAIGALLGHVSSRDRSASADDQA